MMDGLSHTAEVPGCLETERGCIVLAHIPVSTSRHCGVKQVEVQSVIEERHWVRQIGKYFLFYFCSQCLCTACYWVFLDSIDAIKLHNCGVYGMYSTVLAPLP